MASNPDTSTNDGPFSDIRAQRIICEQVKRCLDKSKCLEHPDPARCAPVYEFVESGKVTIGNIDNGVVFNQQWPGSGGTLSWKPEISISVQIGDNFRYLLDYNNSRYRINSDGKVESADNEDYLHKNFNIKNYSRMMVEISDDMSSYYVFIRVKAIIRKDDYSYGIVSPGKYSIHHGFMTNDCEWQHEMHIIHKTAYEILIACDEERVFEFIDQNDIYGDDYDEYPSDIDIIATVKLLADNSYWILVTFRF